MGGEKMGRQCTDFEYLLQDSFERMYLKKTQKVIYWAEYHLAGTMFVCLFLFVLFCK